MKFLEFFENLLEFTENFHTKLKKLRKKWLFVGKFLSFLTNFLEVLGKIA